MNNEKNNFLSRGCKHAPKPHQKNDDLYSNSCCKRNSYNWLDDIEIPSFYPAFPYAEVRFKNSRKDFYKLPDGLQVKVGDIVAVEASPGHEIGIVTLPGETARLQMKQKRVNPDVKEVKKLYRLARIQDIEKWVSIVNTETTSVFRSKKITTEMRLSMKINDVEYQGDGTKATFYYTADERVDFRELIKVLADQFSVRIEMRQIGARQEAAILGGIGTCGRELCCASWLGDFKSVSTNSARVQQMSINPQKLAGQCSKLKCCLNYEYKTYVDALKEFPKDDVPLKTKKGVAYCQKTDVIKRIMWYSYKEEPGNVLPIGIDKVKKIIADNSKGINPDKLEDFMVVAEKEIEFEHYEEVLRKKVNVDMKVKPIYYFIVLLTLFSACTGNAIFDTSKKIEDGVWKSSDIVKFSVPVIDTLQPCNFYINIRNSTDYPFSNLFLFIKTFYPNGKISIDTVECYLSDTEGKWLGNRSGGRVDNRILFRKSFRFRMLGTYSFEFEQAMRTEELHGIEDFGIRIEKFETEK